MDESDKATHQEELARDVALSNALLRGAMNPMRGSFKCSNCGGRNDRAQDGYDLCSACAEDPEWHL